MSTQVSRFRKTAAISQAISSDRIVAAAILPLESVQIFSRHSRLETTKARPFWFGDVFIHATTIVSRHCINIPTYCNATKYQTCEEKAASITRRVVPLLSSVSQGACSWRLDSEWTMRYASAKSMNAASQSKKNLTCEVQETGFSLSFHKFQSFNICLASSFLYASTDQESTHVPLPSYLLHQRHMWGNHSGWKMWMLRPVFLPKKYLWIWYVKTSEVPNPCFLFKLVDDWWFTNDQWILIVAV